jgi:hypothetical protein
VLHTPEEHRQEVEPLRAPIEGLLSPKDDNTSPEQQEEAITGHNEEPRTGLRLGLFAPAEEDLSIIFARKGQQKVDAMRQEVAPSSTKYEIVGP